MSMVPKKFLNFVELWGCDAFWSVFNSTHTQTDCEN